MYVVQNSKKNNRGYFPCYFFLGIFLQLNTMIILISSFLQRDDMHGEAEGFLQKLHH